LQMQNLTSRWQKFNCIWHANLPPLGSYGPIGPNDW
jgi:hypothetical protein